MNAIRRGINLLLAIIGILLFALFMALLQSCAGTGKGNYYWNERKNTGVESYTYKRAGWPYDYSCSTYQNARPTKSSTVRRYYFHRQRKG
jgi:hypothetical protein